MKNKDYTPLIMWFSLVAGIIAIAFTRQGRTPAVWNESPVDFDNIFVCLYIAWMLVELRISRKDADTEGKKTTDSRTCLAYGIGQALTILTALWFPSAWRMPNIAHFAGVALFVLGVCYRLWAVLTLGQFYSHRVRVVARHQIVTSGPYRYTRHPAYAGMIVANVGITVYFCNWVTIFVFALVLLPAILLRIMVEERTLFEIEGYPEFAKTRKRLFPALW